MKLTKDGIKSGDWERKGYSLPKFDREKVEAATRAAPFWIHFGAGNIFRSFQANVVQNLLNDGVLDRGLVVAEVPVPAGACVGSGVGSGVGEAVGACVSVGIGVF